MKKLNLGQTKDIMLPLQGPSLWHEWAKHNKERHRHVEKKKANVTEYNAQKDKEKMEVRENSYITAYI